MKTFFSQSDYRDLEQNDLMDDISKTKFALEVAYSGFDYVTEPDLIDSYIYQVNSILKRYKYLLEKAAERNLLPENETKSEIKNNIESEGKLSQKSPVAGVVH